MISMTWPQYARHECRVEGRHVRLSPQETELLSVLLMRYPDYVPLGDLIGALYENPDAEPEWTVDAVRGVVGRLRGRIGWQYIYTRHSFGYRLCQTEADRFAYGTRGPYRPRWMADRVRKAA